VTDGRRPRLAVLADDLIWATRLESIVRAAGAEPSVVGTIERFGAVLPDADGALVDLSFRRSDPIAAIEQARAVGLPVVAVGAHEDLAARRRALAAGARRVYAYSKLFDDGPRTIAAWLDLPVPVSVPAR
jgi:DNA-binding NarL/FixJ family response regulator